MSWLTQALRALAEVFTFANRRQDLKNTPDMQAARKAQQAVDEANRVEHAIATRNEEDLRKILAE